MEFSVEMSVKGEAADPAFIVATARALERSGFALLGYTDHPAPSHKWLSSGGHPTFDPFAALCFVAAVTERIRLMTYLAVLPYRNPLLLAKSVATVDRLSGGRFTMVAGTGYLRSEFSALGRPFEDRNELFDEAIAVIRNVYRTDEFAFTGKDFAARGVVQDTSPIQLPHPPIWIGGSSRAARRRAASFGDGWAPLRTSPEFARVVRTGELATTAKIGAAIGELRELVAAEGRDPGALAIQLAGTAKIGAAVGELRELVAAEGRDPGALAIQLDGLGVVGDPAGAALEQAAELEAVGVTHVVLRLPPGPQGQVVEAVERFGEEVIARSRR